MSLIDRQAAIDELTIEYMARGMLGEKWAVERCIDAIKNLPSAQEWIPVTERLPENSEKVLITRRTIRFTKDDSGRCIDLGFYYCDLKRWDTMDIDGVEVLAWMPLPEVYKGGDAE